MPTCSACPDTRPQRDDGGDGDLQLELVHAMLCAICPRGMSSQAIKLGVREALQRLAGHADERVRKAASVTLMIMEVKASRDPVA